MSRIIKLLETSGTISLRFKNIYIYICEMFMSFGVVFMRLLVWKLTKFKKHVRRQNGKKIRDFCKIRSFYGVQLCCYVGSWKLT